MFARKKGCTIVLLGFLTFGTITGGLAIGRIRDFDGPKDLIHSQEIQVSVGIIGRSGRIRIPFLVDYFFVRGPYYLQFMVTDRSCRYSQVILDHVSAQYDDGTAIISDHVVWKLAERTQYNSSAAGQTERKEMAISEAIPGVDLKHANVRVTVRGKLVQESGASISFGENAEFEAFSTSYITTGWKVLFND